MHVILRIKHGLCLKLISACSVWCGLCLNCCACGINNYVSPPIHVTLDDHSVPCRILGVRQGHWHDVIEGKGFLIHALHWTLQCLRPPALGAALRILSTLTLHTDVGLLFYLFSRTLR